jgi:hypothetical protein
MTDKLDHAVVAMVERQLDLCWKKVTLQAAPAQVQTMA